MVHTQAVHITYHNGFLYFGNLSKQELAQNALYTESK
jgi:hypothetical protein